MSLSKQIVSDLTASMKAQDAGRTSTLRMVKAAMMNRQIEKGSELDDDDMQKLLRSLVKQWSESIELYEKAGCFTGRDRTSGDGCDCGNRRELDERYGEGDEGRAGRSGREKCRWPSRE